MYIENCYIYIKVYILFNIFDALSLYSYYTPDKFLTFFTNISELFYVSTNVSILDHKAFRLSLLFDTFWLDIDAFN